MEYAILFLPLISWFFNRLFGKSLTNYFAEISTSLFVTISAVLSIIVFWNGIQNNMIKLYDFEWISSGDFTANWSINIDPLSSVMLVVVTFVSALVHIYSIGYMVMIRINLDLCLIFHCLLFLCWF